MKGYIIDCDYIRRVKDYMPRRKGVIDDDGSFIPIISIEVEI